MPSIKRILLIDDDEDEFAIMEEAFAMIDPSIMVTHICEFRQLEAAAAQKPDLVFLDINMPFHDGFEWLRLLRTQQRSFPIVMYSTSENKERLAKAYAEGANLYLTKPHEFSQLLDALKEIIKLNWSEPKAVTGRYLHNGIPHAFKLSG